MKIKNSNVLTVTMRELVDLLDFVLDNRYPLVMWGVKAVGKTTIIYDLAKQRNYRLEVIHLASQDLVDLIGMMSKVPEDEEVNRLKDLFDRSTMGEELSSEELKFVKDMMMSQKMKTVWTRPQWLHDDPEIPTIYFLDEMNRANKFVSAAMLPFLLEGKMHQHKIGPKDVVIAACNPSTGKYAVNDAFEYDEALKDRCGHVILEPTNDEFLSYAEKYLDKTTLSVIKKHTAYMSIEEFDLGFKVEPSRRSLINIMSVVGAKPVNWIRNHGRNVIGAYLGTEFLASWWESKFNKDSYLDISDLIEIDVNKTKIIDAVSTFIQGTRTIKQDIFEESIDRIVEWVNGSTYTDCLTNVDWLIKYLSLQFIPKDSIVSMLSKCDLLDKPQLIEIFYDSGLLNGLPEVERCNKLETILKKD